MKRYIFLLAVFLILPIATFSQDTYSRELERRALLARSDSLFALGIDLYNAGKYQEAVPVFTESDKIDKAVLDSTSNRRDYSAMWLASCYYQLGDTLKAQQTSEYYYITPVDRRLTVKSDSLSAAGLALYEQGDYEAAIACFEQCAEIERSVVGAEHIWYLNSSLILNNWLASYNDFLGNYYDASRYGVEALNIFEKIFGKEHPSYFILLANIAQYKSNLGNYLEAITLCTEALNICEMLFGKEHTNYALLLDNLAGYNCSLSNYSESLRLCTEALNIYEKVYGKQHPEYATSLNTLSVIYAKSGNFSGAIKLGTEALNIREKVYGNEHPEYATSLNNLSSYNSELGNYTEAIRLGTAALNIREKIYGKEHPYYAVTLSNLESSYADLGNYTEAIKLGSEVLNIRQKVYGKEHPYYAITLNNLATHNSFLGNYSEAIKLGTEALNIYERVVDKEHSEYAALLCNLACHNASLGNYSEAIRLGNEALNIFEKILGKDHPSYGTQLYNLAHYNYNSGNQNLTDYYTSQYSELRSSLVKKTFADLTGAQRRMFWEKYMYSYETSIHRLSFGMRTDTLTQCGYNAALLSKGLLLNSDIEFSKLIQESGDSEAVDMYDELRMLRRQINKLLEKPKNERFADVDSLERIAQAKEAALIERSKAYGDYTDNLVITWNQVKEKLSTDEIAVEFVSFPLNADSTMYVAYAVRPEWECPKMIPLFEEKQLKKIYSHEYYTTTDISELVWKPLEEVLEGVETVYFAPSGELYNIAIESVPDYIAGGASIVSDSRTYHRLSSTRELALKKDDDSWKDAAVYGGLKYGMTAEELTEDSRNFSPKIEITLSNETYNIAGTLSAMRGGLLAGRLPGTRNEAEAICDFLYKAGVPATMYADSIGTEASFKNLSGKKTSIMHIGTHGFYWTEKEARNFDYNFLINTEDATGKYVEDKQLTRSGLLFAGANYVLSGSENELPEGVDDGILTAMELTALDLRGLDVVVLSACQTGLGEITGDGVFGLQRGFKKAGAQTIVMSLWKVRDEATCLFMTKFFGSLQFDKDGHPTNKHEAFLVAQRYLREEYETEVTRTINANLTSSQHHRLEFEGLSTELQTITEVVKPYSSPEYWAAFIMLDGIDR